MQKIYTLGETVYDIIFSGEKIESSCVGGSVVNTSISLGRIGLPIYLISQFGNDKIGEMIDSFLKRNNINTNHIYKYNHFKTPLALAFLNNEKDAKYEFYKEKLKKNLEIQIPNFNENDILLFGSFFSINLELRDQVVKFIKVAKKENCIIIYDPNFRNPNKPDLSELVKNVNENIELADIIRGSKDDFLNIFGINNAKEVYSKINNPNKLLIYTDGGNKVELFLNELYLKIPISNLNPFSTVGAGDNFNAGLIYALNSLKINKTQINKLNENDLKMVVSYGVKFAQNVCMSFDNYISEEFANKIKL